MNKMPENQTGRPSLIRWLLRRQTQGRALTGLAALATFVAVFYLEEDWRGWHAWQKCKSELEAKGAVLDWSKFIPPPVPDDQNIFKAPKMAEWFTGRGMRDLSERLQSTNYNLTTSVGAATNLIATTETARAYLAWSDQFQPDFGLMRRALKRPYARMDGDYSVPYEQPIPNFLTVRSVAQTLAQRAHCYLLLNQPEQALRELTLIHDMCRLLEAPPTGKPMTLVAAMINVAVTGLYVEVITEGSQRRVWQEPQLAALQNQLREEDLLPFVLEAFRSEPAAVCRNFEIAPLPKLFSMKFMKINWSLLMPRGWVYQNMVNLAVLHQKSLRGFQLANNMVSPRLFEDASRDIHNFFAHKWPYRFLAAIATPNYLKAQQTTLYDQTMINEAQIVCALERYRLAHGEYPEKLDALVPQFIEKLPHDIIGGGPLIYRPTSNGKFLLYSIGWNETDDGGKESPSSPNGGDDFTKGDWVWKN